MKNPNATRTFSDEQELSVCKLLNCQKQSGSGSGNFNKGDCINKNASLLVECKCSMNEKESFSIKKEWLNKNKEEAFSMRMDNTCLAFNFEPKGKNFFVINEKLMKYLVEKLEEENSI